MPCLTGNSLFRLLTRTCFFDRSLNFSANIEYIKWDMNRPLTEVYSLRENDGIVPLQPGENHTTEEEYSDKISDDCDCRRCRAARMHGLTGRLPHVWQSETSHRYVLGLYELQERITQAFPNILLENCSSGGEEL